LRWSSTIMVEAYEILGMLMPVPCIYWAIFFSLSLLLNLYYKM
jgi:hypothetical protein